MKIYKNGCGDGLSILGGFLCLILYIVLINGKKYQVSMTRHLFHNFCQFLWLLVINIQFFVGRRFFQEPRQTIHLGVVEGLIWFTFLEMLDIKYIKIISYELFSISRFIIGIDALHNIRCYQQMGWATTRSYDNIEGCYI